MPLPSEAGPAVTEPPSSPVVTDRASSISPPLSIVESDDEPGAAVYKSDRPVIIFCGKGLKTGSGVLFALDNFKKESIVIESTYKRNMAFSLAKPLKIFKFLAVSAETAIADRQNLDRGVGISSETFRGTIRGTEVTIKSLCDIIAEAQKSAIPRAVSVVHNGSVETFVEAVNEKLESWDSAYEYFKRMIDDYNAYSSAKRQRKT